MAAEASTDAYAKTKTVLRRSTPVVVPVSLVIGLALTAFWLLRDDALARISKAEARGEAIKAAQEAQDRRLIILETQNAGITATLAEIKAQQAQTNDKLDRLIERMAAPR